MQLRDRGPDGGGHYNRQAYSGSLVKGGIQGKRILRLILPEDLAYPTVARQSSGWTNRRVSAVEKKERRCQRRPRKAWIKLRKAQRQQKTKPRGGKRKPRGAKRKPRKEKSKHRKDKSKQQKGAVGYCRTVVRQVFEAY